MKRAIMIMVLAMLLAASVAIFVGCGGGGSSSGSLTEPEKVVDNAMREAMVGNFQPLINLIPPEMRDTYAQLMQESFPPNGKIDEIHYRTDETDATHVIVYYWGTVEYQQDGQTQKQTIPENQPESLPLVKQDGQWYLDFGSAVPQNEPVPSQ